jgi:tetratricopeptide (TPR) repeat protein
MTRKKENDSLLSVEENAQVQQILAQFQLLAADLYQSASQEQAETALSTITNLSEAAQMALLKELSRQHSADSAAILLAINELSQDKNIRKEARRSLIRLEEAKIYPDWQPPVTHAPIIQLPVANAPRFWKGYVTQSREEGEVQLVLCWEQGRDYSEVRSMTFLLDFWEGGIKEYITENTTRRNVETRVQQMRTQLPDITITDCTLAEGRRLLAEARSANQWRNTPIHKEYRHHLPTINQLIWDAVDVGEDRGQTFISPTLEPDEVVATFIGGWSLGDYGLAYDLLSTNSNIRDGMERDEWLELRRTWAKEAHPTRFELGYVREREAKAPTLWLPNTFGSRNLNARKEIEIAWSLEISDTQLSGTLKEMPMGTTVYKETGRHWFWISYTLIQEQGNWRIQQMTDEGANAQALPIPELQQRMKENDERINELIQQRNQPNSPELQAQTEEVVQRIIQSLHFDDALIVKLPLDRSIVGDAYNRATGIGALERSIVYLDRLAHNFSEGRGEVLRQLGITQHSLSEFYAERGMDDRAQLFTEFATESLREALSIDNSLAAHAVLAELLMQRGDDDLDEAEALLNTAKTMTSTPAEEAMIESDLGNIALQREQKTVALQHFQRVAEIDPNFPGNWFKIGFMQRNLQQFEDAKVSYERAIETEPQNMMPYSELCAIYANQGQFTRAREVLEQGLRTIPKSVHLLALLSSVYLQTGDLRHAQAVLAEAEQVDPNYELVQAIRDELHRRMSSKK